MRFLFLLFIVIPVIEMWLLIKVGGLIGAWPTIGLVLLTAVIGVALLRQQGFQTLTRGRRRLDEGELPAQEMLEAMVLAVSGALLLTPGFMTDGFGFMGLFPPTRRLLVRWAISRFKLVSFSAYGVHPRDSGRDPSALEGEFWRDDDPRRK
jgi:UPF0716 protein FxsA